MRPLPQLLGGARVDGAFHRAECGGISIALVAVDDWAHDELFVMFDAQAVKRRQDWLLGTFEQRGVKET
jgi:hypothetical protein